MASEAHAFFCFEVLSANFQNTQPPSLQAILSLYESSLKSTDNSLNDAPEKAKDSEIPPQVSSVARLQAGDTPSATSSPSTASLNSSSSHLTESTGSNLSDHTTYASQLSITESYPLFVTWNTLSRSGHKSLRGCIGTFEALPLERGLAQYALTSALEDTRFAPIPSSQLAKLSCSLTLLADFEEGKDPFDWTLGVHGVRISFTHRYRRHGATYLPDVAVEQGWSQAETIESLMRKAGWEPGRAVRGSAKPWEEVQEFKLVRYTGLKATASYARWQEWRASIDPK